MTDQEPESGLTLACIEGCCLSVPHDGPCLKEAGREALEKAIDAVVDTACRAFNRGPHYDDAYWVARRTLIALYDATVAVSAEPPKEEG